VQSFARQASDGFFTSSSSLGEKFQSGIDLRWTALAIHLLGQLVAFELIIF
jgi:hypothetical protein